MNKVNHVNPWYSRSRKIELAKEKRVGFLILILDAVKKVDMIVVHISVDI